MSRLASTQHYASRNENARPRVLRNARSAFLASQIRSLYDAHRFSVTDLADVLAVDRAHAWRLLNGGRATAEELNAALAAFSRRAA